MCETKVTYPWEIEAKNSKANTPDTAGVSTIEEFEKPFEIMTVYVPSIQHPYGLWKIVYTYHPRETHSHKR